MVSAWPCYRYVSEEFTKRKSLHMYYAYLVSAYWLIPWIQQSWLWIQCFLLLHGGLCFLKLNSLIDDEKLSTMWVFKLKLTATAELMKVIFLWYNLLFFLKTTYLSLNNHIYICMCVRARMLSTHAWVGSGHQNNFLWKNQNYKTKILKIQVSVS